jgi:PAS domain S-box-containing protein
LLIDHNSRIEPLYPHVGLTSRRGDLSRPDTPLVPILQPAEPGVPDSLDAIAVDLPKFQPLLSIPAQDPHLLIGAALSMAIIEHADDAVIAMRLDGTIMTWNAGAERVFGYTAAEMIAGPISRLFPPDRLQEEGELIARLALGKTISHFATRRLRKDGACIDVSVTLSPVRDASGKIVAVSKFARNITETQERQFASALSAAIVEHSDDAIISKTIDGTVISWNSGAEHMFGYTAEEMEDHPITRLFPLDRLHEEADLVAQLQLGNKISHFETRRIRKDGASIDVSVTLSPVRDADGKIIAISKIARDITERLQWQLARDAAARELQRQLARDAVACELRDKNQQLERSNRDLEDFAYIASHDLKSPLSGINSVALWLEEDFQHGLSDESRKLLGLMRSRINRMETLLHDLLTYSRVGRTDPAAGETRLASIFDNIIEVLNPPAHIKVRVEGELPMIVTAGAQLEQVLRNLINNAIKHHDKQTGEVILSGTQVGNFVEFVVRDDGPGILPQFHDKIFQLFQTLKRRDEVEGTGMGLAIVKKLVERQNCRITVHSEGDGKGTQFRFQWPVLASSIYTKEPANV